MELGEGFGFGWYFSEIFKCRYKYFDVDVVWDFWE